MTETAELVKATCCDRCIQWQAVLALRGFSPSHFDHVGVLYDPTSLFVAVIGSRSAHPSGQKAAEVAARWAVANDAVLISGAGTGIDAAGHRICAASGARQVAAVPGGLAGVSDPYASIVSEVTGSGGVAVSVFEAGEATSARTFAIRNRVVAGMADVVVVAQSGLTTSRGRPAGTLQTLGWAVKAGVPSIVVAPSPANAALPEFAGSARIAAGKATGTDLGVPEIGSFLADHVVSTPRQLTDALALVATSTVS